MKKSLLILLLLLFIPLPINAEKIVVPQDEVLQSIYGETRAQYEQKQRNRSAFYKNELSTPLGFGKKGYFKRVNRRYKTKKMLKKYHIKY